MTKKIDSLEREIRSRPGAAERIDARTEAMRTVLRLAKVREEMNATQTDLAGLMNTTQENVSRIERNENPYLATVSHYVGAMGGRLEINAVFDDHVIPLTVLADKDEG
jgi:DNA-binding XRE family transcriptional regulator